ncbi:MAG: hypothetical protein ACI92E_001722 [Oceanicoccus sp.]|jgi:hypothetical protein
MNIRVKNYTATLLSAKVAPLLASCCRSFSLLSVSGKNIFKFQFFWACISILCFSISGTAGESSLRSNSVSGEQSKADQSSSDGSGEINVEEKKQEQSWIERSSWWLLDTQSVVSQAVQHTAMSIDRYIARDSFDEMENNESYVRLRIIERFGESGQRESEARISAKVDLPNSARKLKLTFDTDPDDFDSIEDKHRDIGIGTKLSDKKKQEATVGLALENLLLDNWKMKLGAGVRLRSALDPYARARFSRYHTFNENWSSRFRETFFYYNSKGWGSDSEIDLYRPLKNDRLLHLSLGGQYLDDENNWEWVHGMSVNQRLDRNNALEYQVGVSANSKPAVRVSNYWVRSKWQHRLFKDWLYFNVTPEVTFPRDESFSATFLINFELELFFSKDPELRNKRIRY